MPAKQVLLHDAAREKIASGVNVLANAVKVTLGPKGRNVILNRSNGPPLVANSGVIVANQIELSDRFENMGAHMLREVTGKTSEVAGDGTTTATVLAQAIVAEGMKYVASGMSPTDIRRGMDKAVIETVRALGTLARPCASSLEIAQVGAISANADAAIGRIIAEAMDRVGLAGAIAIEDGRGLQDELEVVEGMQFERGYLSPYFISNADRQIAVLDDPYVLLYDKKISNIVELMPLLEELAACSGSLLIVAEDVEGEALATLVFNKLRGTLKTVAVKMPGFGERSRDLLDDIATLTGGDVISGRFGLSLEKTRLKNLGKARRVEVGSNDTTLIGGAGNADAIAARAGYIRLQAQKAGKNDRDGLIERSARLSGGVALIRAGAATETGMKERKIRIEDALHATRAAVEEGILPGGGVALVRAGHAIRNLAGQNSDQDAGIGILLKALGAPLRQIVANAGGEASVVLSRVLEGEGNYGYDAATGRYGDLIEMGIIDPVKVTRCALQNAASIAGLILTTGAMVAFEPQSVDIDGEGMQFR